MGCGEQDAGGDEIFAVEKVIYWMVSWMRWVGDGKGIMGMMGMDDMMGDTWCYNLPDIRAWDGLDYLFGILNELDRV